MGESGRAQAGHLPRTACQGMSGRSVSQRSKPSPSYFSALLSDKKKSFGEKIARNIETKLQLPRGWFDQAHVPGEDEPIPGPSKWARLAAQKIDEFPTEEERRAAYGVFVQIV